MCPGHGACKIRLIKCDQINRLNELPDSETGNNRKYTINEGVIIMKDKHSRLHKVLLPVLAAACLVSLLPGTVSAALNDVDVTVLHYYEGIASAVQENKQLEAGEYALSALFVLTGDAAEYKVYEVTGAAGSGESVKFEEGYEYTISIYYAKTDKTDEKDAGPDPAEETDPDPDSDGDPDPGSIPDPNDSSNPTTGDDSSFSFMMILALISLSSSIIIASAGKYKNQI